MKNKKRLTLYSALMAAMFIMAAFPLTAHAGGPDYEEPAETDIVEEKEPTPPLTPEGNLTLVDDVTTADGGEKQFITVVSKNGNYFYLVIDRADDGEGNVHFLNLVDEADLLALLEDGGTESVPAVVSCTCTEHCEAGAVNAFCEVCRNDLAKCEAAPAQTEDAEPEPEKKGNAGAVPALLLLLGLGGGGAFYYLKVLKPKQQTKTGDGLDDLDFEDEEYEDEAEDAAEDTDASAEGYGPEAGEGTV